MGENFERVMDNYFEVFKEKMNNRFKIPPSLLMTTKMMFVLWLIVIEYTYRQSDQEWPG